MNLLFNLEVLEGRRVRARPSDYLRSLSRDAQLREVEEFLQWARELLDRSSDPRERAEAEIGVSTAQQFLRNIQGNGQDSR
ncbi:MAG: hypothetical protein WCC36_16025 [Gammaproteobacteria bacterium]